MPLSFRACLYALASFCVLAAGDGQAFAQCQGDDLFAASLQRRPWGGELRDIASKLPNREGRLWRVSRGNEPPSYIFGTLHLSDPRLTALAGMLVERIRKASILVIETTEVSSLGVGRTNARSREQFRESLQAPRSRRPGTLLDPEDHESLVALARDRGLPPSAARKWKASALALLLDQPRCAAAAAEKQPYLDALVAQTARSAGVEIVGLETLAEQFGIFDGLPAETERALLMSVLRQAPYGASSVESQIARFLARDAGGVIALMRLGPTPETPESRTPPEFLDRLLASRTARMAERVQPILERGNAFVAIGIAHLPGEAGLVATLRRAGWTVSVLD